MAEGEDQLKDLFGSDSDAEEQPDAGAAPQQNGTSEAPAGGDGPAVMTREEQMAQLFGSDEEDEEAAQPGPSGAGAYVDDMYHRDGSPSAAPLRGPPMRVEVPLHDMLHPGPLRLAKLSNVLAIEPRPFDPATYELEAAEYVDERGRKRVRMGDNAMRWRWAEAAPGEPPRRESNARLVRWSDGSVQLAVGDEFFDARDIDVASDQGFLFARHPNLIQGQARLSTKLVFRPASLTGGSHARLAAAVDRQQAGSRQQRVRATTTLVDPRREKEARERAEEAVIKDKERLVDRQARQMKKWAPPPAQRYPALDAGYLEEEEEEEDDGFIVPDDSGDEGDRRPRRPLGADEEAAAAARLAAAKAGGAPPPPGARRPAPAPDSEDEDEDISGDEEEMRGFIVGEGEGEEAEEAAGPRPAAGAPPPKKKRAVVFDSDDD